MYAKKNLKKRAGLLLAGIALASSCVVAQAATVVYEDVDFLFSESSSPLSLSAPSFATKVSSFDIASAGTYQVTLADFVFPEAFDKLSLAISSFVDAKTVGKIDGEGSFTFFATGAGKYYASLFAEPGENYGVGLYGVQVASLSAPVPLPPGIILMMSAIGLLVGFQKKNKSSVSENTTVLTPATA